MHPPEPTELEQAILQYLGSQPPSEGREGTLHVKVTELERVTHPPDSSQFRGGLSLSVPFVGADRTKLDQALARVRKGFKRVEILPGWLWGAKTLFTPLVRPICSQNRFGTRHAREAATALPADG